MRIRLPLILLCLAPVVVSPANAAPTNDAMIDAMPITSLPFWDVQDFETASRELFEPGCDSDPTVATPITEPTVWYRYVSTETKVLAARTYRMFGGYGFTVFRQTAFGLETIACGVPNPDTAGGWDSDVHIGAFTAVAGETYLVQVIGPTALLTTNPTYTSFSLDVARDLDVSVRGVHAETATPSEGFGAWNRWVAFDVRLADWRSGGAVAWEATSCPRGSPLGCSHIAGGAFHLWAFSQGEQRVLWSDRGCLGDVEVRVVVRTLVDLDPNLEDNADSTIIQATLPDPDIGTCPVP